MKFSHSLQFNCVPEWSESYLSYGALKRAIYAIERAIALERSAKKPTHAPSVAGCESSFLSLFESELFRVRDFYRGREQWCLEEAAKLRAAAAGSHDPESLTAHPSVMSSDSLSMQLKKLYVTLHDLKDYLELNRAGFTRIVQKYERYVPEASKKELGRKVDDCLPAGETLSLDRIVTEVESIYALRVISQPVEVARVELKQLLRERVSFERSTIWQDMVEMERKVAGVEVAEKSGGAKSAAQPAAAPKSHHPKQPVGIRLIKLGFCLAVFFGILLKGRFQPTPGKLHFADDHHTTISIDKSDYARRAGAMCILSIMFWCMEIIPLFATAVLVPFLATVLNVFPPDYLAHHGYISSSLLSTVKSQVDLEAGIKKESAAKAKAIFSSMFSANVMLLIGGFSIASALSKHGIAKRLATMVLGRAGRNPGTVLLVIMAITACASTFISNVAAPVLVFTLIQPILRALGVDEPLAKSMVLGVAYAANIGGFMSPISSPQNILTKLALDERGVPSPTTMNWMVASIVCGALCLVITWWTLRFFYPSSKLIPDVLTVKPNPEPLTRKQWMTIIVSIFGIIGLVATDSDVVKGYVGTLGVMAIVPLVLFFGLDLLGKEDFNGFMWNVVMIAMGGGAVGSIAKESGLLESIGGFIQSYISGLPFMTILCIFSALMLVIATFVSHSVSSAVLAPLLVALMEKEYPNDSTRASILVMVTCFVCSIGMGMPISGFPNMTAMSIDDALGRTFIDGSDFARSGLLASVFCSVILLTAGNAIFSFQFSK